MKLQRIILNGNITKTNNMKKECVVNFKNGTRVVSMYFTEEDGNLDMQMSISPELVDSEEPDLPMLLASIFMQALHTDENKNEESPIITTD